jgi:PST family polysaccharide transporter
MGLFTGVQMFNIICSVIKNKFVALCLDAVGVGLFGIFNTTTETISTLSDLGLRQSTVRDVAANKDKPKALSTIISVVRRWCVASGLLGALLISGLSPLLSTCFFNTTANWWMFAILGCSMFMNSLINGEQAIMQGSGMLRNLARSSVIASAGGLIISIPAFYLLGNSSVLVSIFAYVIIGFIATFYFRRRNVGAEPVTAKEVWTKGKGFVKLGSYLAISAFITNMVQLLLIAFLNQRASTETVGYYQAGNTLVVRYVGFVFTALAMEYYPRLAANIESNRRVSVFVSQEITSMLVVLTPIVIIFIAIAKWIVTLLYASGFTVIVPFVSFAILSCIFKAVSWSMAYVILAKGDGKMYIITETTDAIVGLLLCCIFFELWGLLGIGIAFILWFMIYTFIVGFVYRRRYKLNINTATLKLASVSLIIGAIVLIASYILPIYATLALSILLSIPFLLRVKKMWTSK